MPDLDTRMGSRTIVLAGFMGTGKSSVGRRLAARLGREFVDTDALIEQEAGTSITRIFADQGEAEFRAREKRAVAVAVGEDGRVVAVGGGAILDRENLAAMKAGGPVVCLTARPEIVLARVAHDTGRPLLQGPQRLETIRGLMAERADAYARVDVTIDTSDLTPDELVEHLLNALADAGFRL